MNLVKIIPLINNLNSKKLFVKGSLTNRGPLVLSRNAKALNPIFSYNGQGLTQANENQFVRHGSSIYIGGTTETIELDFFTKTAGSTVGCPLKIYGQDVDLANLPNPSTGWVENTTQSDLDMLKQQDNIALTKSTTTSGKARAMMIELDMTEITQNVYGNSNANMKTNFQTSSNIDFYVVGSGANAGATGYGCKSYAWNSTTSTWELLGENTNSTIQLTNRVLNKSDYISSSNKTYILLVPSYPSDGTIASSISLDYMKFKMNFNRTADVVVPLTHNFANKWTILLKDLFFININNPKPIKVGNIDINLSSIISSKKMHNVLIYQDGTNIKYYALANNGTLQSGTISESLVLGTQNITFNANDYYFGMIYVLSSYIPADNNEGLAILRGEKAGFENSELLYSSEFDDISKWTLSNNAQINNKTLILSDWNSTGTQNCFVFPNNQYEIVLTKKDQMGVVEVEEYYSKSNDVNASVSNDIFIRSQVLGAGLTKFTTSNYTNKIRVKLKNQLEGFSRDSIAYLSDGTQVANNVPRLETVSGNDKAILIEEGTQNLATGKTLTENFNGWSRVWADRNNYEIVDNEFGRKSIKVFPTDYYGGGNHYISYNTTLNAGTYTAQIKVKIPSTNIKKTVTFEKVNNDWSEIISKTTTISNDQYNVLFVTFTLNTTKNIMFNFVFDGAQQGDVFYVTEFQLEQKPYPTSFVDGTRQPEILKVPTAGILNPSEGTVEMYLKVPYIDNWNNFMQMDSLSNGRFLLYFDKTYKFARFDYCAFNQGATTPNNSIQENTWMKFAMRWSATSGKMALFLDGVKYEKNLPNGVAAKFPNIVSVVNNYSSIIADLHFSSIARTDADIQNRATNGFTVDQYSTYYLNFDKLAGAEISKVSLKEKF